MTTTNAPQIAPHTIFKTTEVDRPFEVRLAGNEADDVVTVRDQVIVGDRAIVRGASGEGFWHIAANEASDGVMPTAVFEPHPTVCFEFPARHEW